MPGEEIMSREAMQMALEALESDPISHAGLVSRKQAITALRQALEEKQKPVAWASSLDFDDDDQEIIPAKDKGKLGTGNCDIALYTAPPKFDYVIDCPRCGHCCPERTWVWLTDDEVSDVIDDVLEGGGWLDVSRALEAAIKRKNT
jgi:hypothetical protein